MVPKPQVKTLALTEKAVLPGLDPVSALALLFSSSQGVTLAPGTAASAASLLVPGSWDYLVSVTSGQVTEELN